MKIQIIGPKKDPAFQIIQQHFLQAIHELQVEATLDEVTDVKEISNYPLSLYPAIYINNKLVCQGHSITLEQAKQCIRDYILDKDERHD